MRVRKTLVPRDYGIIRDDLIGYAHEATPSIWNYAPQRDADSMITTPPTFAWYLCSLVFKHIRQSAA